ncbi:MAG: SDR family oxidoreductase [Planctomycetaceae bacterium]
MRKRVVGCGYLGRRVADVWVKAGDDVFAMTRSDRRAKEFRAAGIEPVLGDVTLPETLAALPAVDTVLYAVGFDRSIGDSMRDVYVGGLRNVLDRIADSTRRFLYVSSTSVYGQTGGEWVDEDSSCKPVTPNGIVCRDAERLVWDAFPPGDADERRGANVLRLAGIYGPGRMLRRIEAVRSGEPIAGDAEAFLNLIHVNDAVRILRACENIGRPGRSYLVCDDHPPTRREYYETLAELSNAPTPVFDATAQTGLNKRCHNDRIKTELGVSLRYPAVRDGLQHALMWDGL